MSSIKLITYCY